MNRDKMTRSYRFLIITLVVLLVPGCHFKREPKVTTAEVTEIGPKTALTGGEVTHDGYVDVIVKGVCYGTKKSPDIEGTRTTDGYGEGPFVSILEELTPNTLYYVRAYAINDEGVGYGSQITFTTTQYGVPVLTTANATGITQVSAVSGGNISSDGGLEVTERGVCWSTSRNPTTSNSRTTNGEGTGPFTSNITGLTGNTTYYIRAYAVNEEGTGYGQEVTFKTSPVLPSVNTAIPSATGTGTGSGGGTVTAEGGSPVTARGVCWSTSANPTISNSRTNDGGGPGSFASEISGLSPNTTYHVRAYATNSVGTAYGNDVTFTTDPLTVTDNDDNSYSVIRLGNQLWMGENLRTTTLNDDAAIANVTGGTAWSGSTTPAYCWYNNTAGNGITYGVLYNWHAVNSGKLCPTGWHVPTDDEWYTLVTFLGGESPSGGKLKEEGTAHWQAPNTGATNESDFTALPGGWRRGDNGAFESLGVYGYWWTSSELTNPWYRRIWYNDDRTYRGYIEPDYGMSVRCIKN